MLFYFVNDADFSLSAEEVQICKPLSTTLPEATAALFVLLVVLRLLLWCMEFTNRGQRENGGDENDEDAKNVDEDGDGEDEGRAQDDIEDGNGVGQGGDGDGQDEDGLGHSEGHAQDEENERNGEMKPANEAETWGQPGQPIIPEMEDSERNVHVLASTPATSRCQEVVSATVTSTPLRRSVRLSASSTTSVSPPLLRGKTKTA
jgi:hypothetical protein